MKRRIFHLISNSILAALALASVAIAADPRVCVLKYEDGSTPSYKSGTPCTTAATAHDGTKNLIKFDQGCGGNTYKVAVVYEQGSSNMGLGSYELFMGFKASDFGAPVYASTPSDCTFNPNSLNYFPTIMSGAADCPGGSGDSSYVHGAAGADLSNPYAWPSPAPNIDLFAVKFNSMNYTETNKATATIAFTNKPQSSLYDPNSTEITTFTYQDADAYCEAPPFFVKYVTTGATITPGTPSCSGTPPSGTVSGIKISYPLPTTCLNGSGATEACPATCTALGVTVKKTAPGSEEVLATKTTATSVTDSAARAAGTAVTYSIQGVCATGTGPQDSSEIISINYTPECGNPPSIATCKAGSKDCSATDISGFQNGAIKITGTLTDSDSTASQLQAGLYYGTEDNNPSFPTYVAATVGSDKSFTAEIPGTAVRKDVDIYFALWATDQTSLTSKSPATYDGTGATGYTIYGENISIGTALGFAPGYEPYPNQFPFRAAGQRLVIGFQLNDTANVTMRIYSTDGTLVRQIESSTSDPNSYNNVCNYNQGCSWDGTTYLGSNNWVPNGMYIVNIFAVGTGDTFGGQTLSYTKGLVVMK